MLAAGHDRQAGSVDSVVEAIGDAIGCLAPEKIPEQGAERGPDSGLVEDQTELDLSVDLPTEGVVGHYVIRRTDELGRAEASNTSVRVINVDSTAHPPVSMPAWPDIADWPVSLESGQVRLIACWTDRIGSEAFNTIELLSQAYGQAVVVAATPEWSPPDRYVLVTMPVPAVKTRYRWRFTSSGGSQQYTTFSAWLDPTPTPTQNLQQIGASA